jgi:hypothetical protein
MARKPKVVKEKLPKFITIHRSTYDSAIAALERCTQVNNMGNLISFNLAVDEKKNQILTYEYDGGIIEVTYDKRKNDI